MDKRKNACRIFKTISYSIITLRCWNMFLPVQGRFLNKTILNFLQHIFDVKFMFMRFSPNLDAVAAGLTTSMHDLNHTRN